MKPKIIELIGPPGIGKSTVYQSLCKTWKPGSQWVYPDVLLASKPRFLSFSKWLEYHLRLVLRKKLTKSIPIDYGLRFAGQQQQLATFCWNYLSDIQFSNDEEINKRFRSAYFLFSNFCMYQAILEKAPAKPCIIQEGFLQKSFFIQDDQGHDQLINELLNKYLLLIPLPYAIIYMDTPDINEIIKRLRGRNKIIASHLDKDDEALQRDIEKWQQTHNRILEKLKSAGVLIVKINGRQPVKDNVSRIKELLKNIDDAPEASCVHLQNGSKQNPLTGNNTFAAGFIPSETWNPTERY
jgi:adenylate kinase family enzyme